MMEGRPAAPKGLRRLLSAAAIGFFLSSCGIDILSVLDTPPVYISPLVFKGPIDPDAALYYGVDVFYRIYATEEGAIADRDKLLAKQALANALPGDAIKNYLLADGGLKYKRLYVNQNEEPSLKKAFLGSYTAKLSYNADVGNELAMVLDDDFILPLAETITLKRSNDAKSSFFIRPNIDDSDYQSNADDPDPDRYYLHFFAASYGIDIANGSFNDLYSDAVSIGIQAIDY
jgi:hypothetical protein